MSTRICLVRHGETAWNAERRLQGHLDIPLNEHGLAQAAATARSLGGERFDAAYCSDLTRARQLRRRHRLIKASGTGFGCGHPIPASGRR